MASESLSSNNASGKEIAMQNAKELSPADMKNTALEYLRSTGLSLPRQYEAQFLNACVLYGLNPFKREIYAVGYGDKWNVIVGYEVYLKRAERTGKLDGWQCEVSGTGSDMKATLTVYRKDWSHPFVHETWFAEMQQQSPIWRKMPRLMLKKTAIAQGFRQCFPDEMGGLPYAEEELPVINVTPEHASPATSTPPINTAVDSTKTDAKADTKPKIKVGLSAADVARAKQDAQEAKQEAKQEEDQANALKKLNELSFKYKKELAGRPLELISECKANDGDAVAMLNRTVTYLARKGIEL